MKKDCPQTSKFKRLAQKLNLKYYEAVGVLQSLWLMAETEAKKGDIGRRSNRQIAMFLEWTGDPDELIAILVECGWLDEDPDCRLVIHDRIDHAPNYIRGGLINAERAKAGEPRLGSQGSDRSKKEPKLGSQGSTAKDGEPRLGSPEKGSLLSYPILSIYPL